MKNKSAHIKGVTGWVIRTVQFRDVPHIFYRGWNDGVIRNHSNNGSDGMLILFIDANDIPKSGFDWSSDNNYVSLNRVPDDMEITDENLVNMYLDVIRKTEPLDYFVVAGLRRGII